MSARIYPFFVSVNPIYHNICYTHIGVYLKKYKDIGIYDLVSYILFLYAHKCTY